MFELRHLRAFLAVAEELHFGRAAQRLNISQPPLTQQIRQLESAIGVALFDRDRRGTQLTPAGAAFLPEARRLQNETVQAAETARRAARGETGILRVGFSPSAAVWLLPEAMRGYRSRHRDVVLQLVEETTSRQMALLRSGQIDIGIARGPIGPDAQGLRVEVIQREQLLAVLPSTHRLARRRTLRLPELEGEPLLLFPRHVAPGFYDAVLHVCRRARYTPNISDEATEFQTLVSLVAARMGVTLVPASFRSWRRDGVVYVKIQQCPPVAELIAVHDPRPAVLVEGFLNELRLARKS